MSVVSNCSASNLIQFLTLVGRLKILCHQVHLLPGCHRYYRTYHLRMRQVAHPPSFVGGRCWAFNPDSLLETMLHGEDTWNRKTYFVEAALKAKKHIKRTGWVLSGVEQPESVAGHMYRMAIMTFLLEEHHHLNKSRCMELALIHDIAECIVGDITPFCGVSPEEKHKRERDAMKELAQLVGSSASYLLQLYEEYETQSSPEAEFVKDLDRFDMVLQAFEYEKSSASPVKLQQFFDSVKGKLKHPLITSLADELDKQRNNFQGNT